MNFIKILIIIIFIPIALVHSALNISVLTNDSSPLIRCLIKATSNFFIDNGVTWITLNKTESNSEILNDIFLKNLMVFHGHKVSITSSKIERSLDNQFWSFTDHYIFETSTVNDLRDTIRSLKFLHSWNSHGKFLIIGNNIINETEKVISGMIETLWFEGIYNFVFAVNDPTNSSFVNFYSWYPYRCKNGQEDYSAFQVLDACVNGEFINNTNLYPEKIPKDLNSCPLRVGAVVWPPYVMYPIKRFENTNEYIINDGIDARLVKVIGNKLNLNVTFTLSEKSLNWGNLLENGTATGLMAVLRSKKIDIAIASLTPNLQRLKYFEISKTYFFETFTWCVPHANTQHSWKKLLYAINYICWIYFLLAFVFFSIMIWLLSKDKHRPETTYKQYLNCLQNTFSVAVSVAVKQHPKTSIVRLIFFLWIIFSINFGTLYETQLFSIFTRPIYGFQIASIEDIERNNLKIFTPTNILSYFNNNSTLNAKILQDSSECRNIKECFSHVAYHKDSALCVSSSYTDYVKKSYLGEDNIPLIYCFQSNIATYPVVFLMKKGFALKPRVNNIVSRLTEGGFVNLWATKIFDRKWKKEETSKFNHTNIIYGNKLMNLENLKPLFVCFLIGLGISVIVFIAEIIISVYKFFKGKTILIV